MRFPDRPAATAGLGVACALVLLVILSWPTIFGSQNAQNLAAANSSTVARSSTTGEIATQETQTMTSTGVETTNSNTAYTLNSGLPSVATGSGANSSATLSPSSSSTTSVSSITQAGTTVVSSVSTMAVPQSSNEFSALSAATSSIPSGYWIFTVLALVSLAIAIGSTLFIRKRVNPA